MREAVASRSPGLFIIPLSKKERHVDAHMDAKVNQATAVRLKLYDETPDRKDAALM